MGKIRVNINGVEREIVRKGRTATYDKCQVPFCGDDHYGRGMCVRHYRQWSRTGCVYTASQVHEYERLLVEFNGALCGDPQDQRFSELLNQLEEYVHPNRDESK